MASSSVKLQIDLHVKYIQSLDTKHDDLEYWLTEHLRLGGIYWGLTALDLMNHIDALDRNKVIEYVKACQQPDGGFGGHIGHDSHIQTTLNAIHILSIYDALDAINTDKVIEYVAGLQDKGTGAFYGDKWGELDTRFIYIAFQCLAILKRLDAIDVEMAIKWILSCMNFDGGFGAMPGSESHGAQIFVCVAALAIADRLHLIDEDLLGWWLCERQQKSGGLNGRPEKLEDSCYSWWVLSSLRILGRLDWINKDKLCEFILSCQDPEIGGISDRPGNMVDVYHTHFGIAGLSLLGYPGLKPIDPVYCLPKHVVQRLGLPENYKI
ncbi:uncharacterized protein VTP21DRAFT_8389 [Calcarisporiella thermophila]|uniref:uncharacterized protein n=1 Tax=Calcarisporiella thermophila TaxID=911321 RepID=UPI0037425F1A